MQCLAVVRQHPSGERVILAPGDYAAWLGAETPADHLQGLVRPCPEAGWQRMNLGDGNFWGSGLQPHVPPGKLTSFPQAVQLRDDRHFVVVDPNGIGADVVQRVGA